MFRKSITAIDLSLKPIYGFHWKINQWWFSCCVPSMMLLLSERCENDRSIFCPLLCIFTLKSSGKHGIKVYKYINMREHNTVLQCQYCRSIDWWDVFARLRWFDGLKIASDPMTYQKHAFTWSNFPIFCKLIFLKCFFFSAWNIDDSIVYKLLKSKYGYFFFVLHLNALMPW